MLGRADQGYVSIDAMALDAARKGSILAVPEAGLVMTLALPRWSTLGIGLTYH
jgi:hypothetical protein